jgi:hypothetical protein
MPYYSSRSVHSPLLVILVLIIPTAQLEGGQIGGSARILAYLSVISTKPSFVQRGELRQAAGYLTRDRVTGH